MGTRYFLTVKCGKCGITCDNVYYAPTCSMTTFECSCGNIIDLEKLTGISAEDTNSAAEINAIIRRFKEKDVKNG